MKNWLGITRVTAGTPALGERELAVLEVLWAREGLSAQQILDSMPDAHSIGLNTIQSTIERLFRKQVLWRRKIGRCYVYGARQSRAELIKGLLSNIANELGGGDMASMVSGFLGFLAEAAPEHMVGLRDLQNDGAGHADAASRAEARVDEDFSGEPPAGEARRD